MKWVCWNCGRENPYHPARAVQERCPGCGEELKIARAPLAGTTNVAGFLMMVGGVLWGFDHLTPAPFSFPVFLVLALLFALAVGGAMVGFGLSLYNRAARNHREGVRR